METKILNAVQFLNQYQTLKTYYFNENETEIFSLNLDFNQGELIKKIYDLYENHLRVSSKNELIQFAKVQAYHERERDSILMEFLKNFINIYFVLEDNYKFLFSLRRISFNLHYFRYSDTVQITIQSFINWGTTKYSDSHPMSTFIDNIQNNDIINFVSSNVNYLKNTILEILALDTPDFKEKDSFNPDGNRTLIQKIDSDNHIIGWFINHAED